MNGSDERTCPLCGSSGGFARAWSIPSAVPEASQGTMYACRGCGVWFSAAAADPGLMGRLAAVAGAAAAVPLSRLPREMRLAPLPRALFRTAKAVRLRARVAADLRAGWEEKALRLPSLLAGYIAGGAPRSLLDVGCGDCQLLSAADLLGWRTLGVEPVEAAARLARARGANVVHGLFEDLALGAGFGAVTFCGVLAHTRDPRACMSRARASVDPRGRVFVLTGNVASPDFMSSRGGACAWWPLTWWGFPVEAMRRLMAEAGLALTDVWCEDPSGNGVYRRVPVGAAGRCPGPHLLFVGKAVA